MKKLSLFLVLILFSIIVNGQQPFMHEIMDGNGLSSVDLKKNSIEWILAYQKRDKNINKNLRNLRDLTLKYPVYSWNNGDVEIIQTCYGLEIKGIVFTFTINFEIKDSQVLVVLDNVLFTTMGLPGADFNSIYGKADLTGVLLGKKGYDKTVEEKYKPLIINYLKDEFLPSLKTVITKEPYEIENWD